MASLTVDNLRKAFALLGQKIGPGRPVSILVVGGAAGMLTGELIDRATTEDVDVMAYLPPGADAEVDDEAIRAVGAAMQFGTSWYEDSQVRLKRLFLPDDWPARAVLIGTYGRLTVLAAGRLDLLAMKVGATRAKDRQDVLTMKPTRAEIDWVRQFLEGLADEVDVTRALGFVDALKSS